MPDKRRCIILKRTGPTNKFKPGNALQMPCVFRLLPFVKPAVLICQNRLKHHQTATMESKQTMLMVKAGSKKEAAIIKAPPARGIHDFWRQPYIQYPLAMPPQKTEAQRKFSSRCMIYCQRGDVCRMKLLQSSPCQKRRHGLG